MEKKKTSNMLIRAVPLDIWERVEKLCRRKGYKRRDFIEHALSFFEEGETHLENTKETEKIQSAEAKIYEMAEIIKLKKKIGQIRKDIDCIDDRKTEMNMLLELKKAEEVVNQSIKETIPNYEIPKDEEARREMGLPEEYCKAKYERYAIWEGYDRGFDRPIDKELNKTDPIFGENPRFQKIERELERKFEEFKRQTEKNKGDQEAGQKIDTTGLVNGIDEGPVKKENDSEVKMRLVDSIENVLSSEEKKKEIKTTFFGRGFEGLDDE